MEHVSGLTGSELEELSSGIPDADFRPFLGMRAGSLDDFFAPRAVSGEILCERSALLTDHPHRHSDLLPAGAEPLEELLRLIGMHSQAGSPLGRLRELGCMREPDVLLLRPDAEKEFRLAAGCVCFPSAWSLEEKINCTLPEIHAPAANLNAVIGAKIGDFLQHMKPGAWLRSNWGISRFPDRNQHPALGLPQLDASVAARDMWLRMEHQILAPLPETHSVVFGIRIAVHALTDLARYPTIARNLYRQIKTMPPSWASYKRIEQVRDAILQELTSMLDGK